MSVSLPQTFVPLAVNFIPALIRLTRSQFSKTKDSILDIPKAQITQISVVVRLILFLKYSSL